MLKVSPDLLLQLSDSVEDGHVNLEGRVHTVRLGRAANRPGTFRGGSGGVDDGDDQQEAFVRYPASAQGRPVEAVRADG